METVKLDYIEHSETQTCFLEESDVQCGHVFYNEITRLLKFYCTYCRETYDNIEYFCQHLSDHITESNEIYNEVEPELFKEQDLAVELVAEIDSSKDTSLVLLDRDYDEFEINSYPSSEAKDENIGEFFMYDHPLEEISLSKENIYSEKNVDNLNDEEHFIDEIDGAEDMPDEIEKEIDEIEGMNTNRVVLQESCSSTEISDYNTTHMQISGETNKLIDDVKNGSSFEECFIKETNIDKIRSEGVCILKEKNHDGRKPLQRKRSNIQDLLRLKRRRKKVTTVKVIAVKNRIAELYEKIQNEQQKSQQFFTKDFSNVQQEQETQDAIESLIKDEVKADNNINMMVKSHSLSDNKTNQSTSEIARQIIGETLITLIPEGTKIPNKMPSPVKELMSNEKLPITSTSSYNHYKSDDKKEKKAICPACGKIFRSHFSLTIHKRIHYLESDSSVKLAHKCSDCDQLFNKLSQLKHHVETVHYPEGFICKICNRQLSSLSLLERHMVKVHLDRPFNCKICNKNFSDPLTFEEHLASHNSGEVFKCTTCGRKYSTEYFLLEHMRNHKEQVPQTCVVCGKVTLRITQHMKIHTPRPKRLLSCSECGKVFNFSSGLSHHFKIMHKLPRPPPKLKKEMHANTFKRKRRSRTNERSINKKKQLPNLIPTKSTFITDTQNFPDKIIEEQIEISHEENGTATAISNIERKEMENIEGPGNVQNSSHTYNLSNSRDSNQVIIQHFEQDDIIYHKEEEAKRVIVELIQNSTYTSFFPDNLSSVLEITPPIAREETISAVNSIVHEN